MHIEMLLCCQEILKKNRELSLFNSIMDFLIRCENHLFTSCSSPISLKSHLRVDILNVLILWTKRIQFRRNVMKTHHHRNILIALPFFLFFIIFYMYTYAPSVVFATGSELKTESEIRAIILKWRDSLKSILTDESIN